MTLTRDHRRSVGRQKAARVGTVQACPTGEGPPGSLRAAWWRDRSVRGLPKSGPARLTVWRGRFCERAAGLKHAHLRASALDRRACQLSLGEARLLASAGFDLVKTLESYRRKETLADIRHDSRLCFPDVPEVK